MSVPLRTIFRLLRALLSLDPDRFSFGLALLAILILLIQAAAHAA